MRLIEERKRRGWSQAELARRAHLNAATVSLIESGRLTPYPSQVRKIADALGLPPAQAHLLLQEDQAEESLRTTAPGNAAVDGG
jgi:transcriptional regulator with XRE-family HTH domain